MIEVLKQALEALENNRQTHRYCEDTWYSCPKHEDGCANDSEGDECNCGADKANIEIDAAITSLRQAIREHAMYEVQRLGQEIEQESVAFLANAMRFKLSFDSEGKVNCFWNQKELDGRWVALVAAEDDCHLKLTHPPQRTEQEPVECDGDFPEGFDKSLDIPAQALRQANAALCEVTNNRMWDVPALAERMLMFCRNTHPPQRTEPVAFKIYKPTPPRHAIPNVRDAELPWVYDQDPSSGNVASMWVTPVKHTRPPQRTEQEPVQEPKNYRHTWGKDGEGCVICGDKDWMNTSCKPLAPQRTEQKPVKWADYEPDGMHHNKPTPQRTWVGSGDLEDSNSYLNTDEKNT